MTTRTAEAQLNAQDQTKNEIFSDLNSRAQKQAGKEFAGSTLSELRSATANVGGADVPHIKLVSDDKHNTDELDEGGGNWLMIFGSVPAGAVGIRDHWGQVEDNVLPPGMYLKTPLATGITTMSTRLHKDVTSADASTKDLQSVSTEVTVPFSIDPTQAVNIFKKVGNLDAVESKIINPGVLESLKAVTAAYEAPELLAKRQEVKDKFDAKLKGYINKALEDKGLPGAIDIGNIAITNFHFSDAYAHSIELKQVAAQDASRAKNEKEKKETEADANKYVANTGTDAKAYETRQNADAEAYAIGKRGEALKAYPQVLQQDAIHQWSGGPTSIGGGSVPFFNLNDFVAKKTAKEKSAQ